MLERNKPFNAQEDTGVSFHRNYNSILRRHHQKNFLWALRLWVGRRKEPILGYVPKNDEEKNLVHKGLSPNKFWNFKLVYIKYIINSLYFLKPNLYIYAYISIYIFYWKNRNAITYVKNVPKPAKYPLPQRWQIKKKIFSKLLIGSQPIIEGRSSVYRRQILTLQILDNARKSFRKICHLWG